MVYDLFQYVHSTVIIGVLQYQSEVIANGGNRRRKRQTQQYLLLLQNVSNPNSIIVKITYLVHCFSFSTDHCN